MLNWHGIKVISVVSDKGARRRVQLPLWSQQLLGQAEQRAKQRWGERGRKGSGRHRTRD